MAFRELGGGNTGNILKWATPGQVVVGRLIGTKRGKVFNGKPTTLAVIGQSDGVQITLPLPTALESRFIENDVKPGALLRITYNGEQVGKSGVKYKGFTLEIDDGSPLPANGAPAPAQQPQQPASDYDVLAEKLKAKVGDAATAMLNVLSQMFPDPAARLENLKSACKQQGVAV